MKLEEPIRAYEVSCAPRMTRPGSALLISARVSPPSTRPLKCRIDSELDSTFSRIVQLTANSEGDRHAGTFQVVDVPEGVCSLAIVDDAGDLATTSVMVLRDTLYDSLSRAEKAIDLHEKALRAIEGSNLALAYHLEQQVLEIYASIGDRELAAEARYTVAALAAELKGANSPYSGGDRDRQPFPPPNHLAVYVHRRTFLDAPLDILYKSRNLKFRSKTNRLLSRTAGQRTALSMCLEACASYVEAIGHSLSNEQLHRCAIVSSRHFSDLSARVDAIQARGHGAIDASVVADAVSSYRKFASVVEGDEAISNVDLANNWYVMIYYSREVWGDQFSTKLERGRPTSLDIVTRNEEEHLAPA